MACEEEGAPCSSGCLFLLGEQRATLPMGAGPTPPHPLSSGGADSPGTALSSHQKWGSRTHWRGLNVVVHAPRACHRDSVRALGPTCTPYSQL